MASNCYGYALGVDLPICPGTRHGEESEVFSWSEGFERYPFIDRQKEVLFSACRKDGLRLSDSSKRQVAMFVHRYKDCIDYHFYRLDLNERSWSMQDSHDGPITVGIRNPVEHDQRLVGTKLVTGTLCGQKYAGLLYLPSGDDMTNGWD